MEINSRVFDRSITELSKCLGTVQKWMDSVKLKLNPDKTEFIIIGDKNTRDSLAQKFPVDLLQSSVIPAEKVKNLGVTFDSSNGFDCHISNVC